MNDPGTENPEIACADKSTRISFGWFDSRQNVLKLLLLSAVDFEQYEYLRGTEVFEGCSTSHVVKHRFDCFGSVYLRAI